MNLQEEIKSLKAHIALIEKQLADENKQEEPVFERVTKENKYFYLRMNYDEEINADYEYECGYDCDYTAYNTNNYFHSNKRAREVSEKIKMLLKLERLHDAFCPDYVPNWDCNDEKKHCVYYDNDVKYYKCNYVKTCKENNVYFSTEEIAQKVCDILNAEKEAE